MIAALYKFLIFPLAYTLLQILRPFLKGKTLEMIQDKNKKRFHFHHDQTLEKIATQRPFWIHAASGEIEYARPVIRELKKTFPETPVLVTFSSPSAKKILTTMTDVDAWGPLPWDTASACDEFLIQWQPRAWLIARTDVWPVMAERAAKKQIPSLLFAATFAENSSRLKGLSAQVTAWALNNLSEIHCVSEDDIQQLKVLNLKTPAHAHGDTRFDQVFYRLQNPRPTKQELKPTRSKPVLVAGSTWPEDEAVLLPAYAAHKERLRLILAPHEIHETHLKPLEAELDQLQLSHVRYSQTSDWTSKDVLILDQIGILAEIYTWGNFAFVGGSFRKQVHSVMEPLAAGLPVMVGPYHHNNREALVFKTKTIAQQPVVRVVTSSEEFKKQIEDLLGKLPAAFAANLKQILEAHMNSSHDVLQWCQGQQQLKN